MDSKAKSTLSYSALNNKLIRDLPQQLRPRERLFEFGVSNLSDQELLAVILGSGSKKQSVLKLATKILKKFSLQDLLSTKLLDLTQFLGIGQIQASKILSAVELGFRAQLLVQHQVQINNPGKVFQLMAEIKIKQQESAYALYINGRQELLEKKLIALGGLNANLIEARSVFSRALALPSSLVILVHNHPSGDPHPSPDDIDVTNKLAQAGELLGVHLLDHVIISQDKFFSFKEEGLL